MRRISSFLWVTVLLLVVGCATVPTGPSVMVLPTPGKPLEVFQAEDATCRMYARQQIGLSPQETFNQNTAVGAVRDEESSGYTHELRFFGR